MDDVTDNSKLSADSTLVELEEEPAGAIDCKVRLRVDLALRCRDLGRCVCARVCACACVCLSEYT